MTGLEIYSPASAMPLGIPLSISAHRFDVDKKFHIDTASDDDTWLNMYGRYNPFDDTLRIECEFSRQESSSYFDYEPTKDEAQLVKDMIAEKIQEDYHQTPQEFCEEYYGEDPTIGGIL